MKSIVKSIVAAAVLYAASATAAVLPTVGTGTEPNQWTRNMEGVLAAAKTTGLPILLVMINDSSTGDGCQHCMQFARNTLNTDNFANIVASYKFYMVLLNKWPSETAYGNVSETYFRNYFLKYEMGDSGYPQVIIIKPDGKRYAGWSYETRPVSSSGPRSTSIFRRRSPKSLRRLRGMCLPWQRTLPPQSPPRRTLPLPLPLPRSLRQ